MGNSKSVKKGVAVVTAVIVAAVMVCVSVVCNLLATKTESSNQTYLDDAKAQLTEYSDNYNYTKFEFMNSLFEKANVIASVVTGNTSADTNAALVKNLGINSFVMTDAEGKIIASSDDKKVGTNFLDDETTKQFKAAVEDLQSQGMKGLVIDIRNNPGGVLKTVADMLDYILPNGLIVYTETKSGKRQEYSGSDNHELNIPMAVLVNGNSASASEIFAGAMQDYDKAQIIGTQTFGKGIVQTIRPLTDGSAVKYTIAKYFTPKGQDIHGKGVTPDSIVELPDDATEDVQLKAAVEYLNGKMSVSAAE